MAEKPLKWDGSPSFTWRVKHWCWTHVGLIILSMIVVLWVYAPDKATIILDANMAVMRELATWFAAVVPTKWGGSIMISVIELMDTITGVIKDLTQSKILSGKLGLGPRTELLFRLIYEGLFLYFEIKIVRFILWIILPLLRLVGKSRKKKA